MKRYETKKSGFTLIELLVVIAVIGVLAVLLLPALRKAKEQAKMTVCTDNLKQLGIAMRAYADDWNGELPPMEFPRDNNSQDCHLYSSDAARSRRIHLGALLPTYIPFETGRKTLYCPQVEKLEDDMHRAYHMPDEPIPYNPNPKDTSLREGCSSYSYHDRLGQDPGSERAVPILLSKFSASEPLVADAVYYKWHDTGWNCLYMDGSVKYVISDKLFDEANQALTWIILGSTFHQDPKNDPQ